MHALVSFIAGLTAWIALTMPSSAQSYVEDLDGKSASELFEMSNETLSLEVRTIIRKRIVTMYPDSPEGMQSRGFVLSQNGETRLAQEQYIKCIETSSFTPCIRNAIFQERKNSDFLRNVSVRVDYNYSAYWVRPAVENIARYLTEYGSGIEEAEAYLADARTQLSEDSWIVPHALGYTYKWALNKPDEAEAYLIEAVEAGSTDFYTYSLITRIRRDRQNSRAIQRDRALYREVFEYIYKYAAKFPNSAEPYKYLAEFEESLSTNNRAGLPYYRAAYAKQATPEFARKVLEKECSTIAPNSPEIKASLAEKKDRFGDSPTVLYGMYECFKPTDRKTSLELLAQASTTALNYNDRQTWSLRYYNELALATLDYKLARETILPYQTISSYNKNRAILATAFAGMHEEAKTLWREYNRERKTVSRQMIESSYRIDFFEDRVADIESARVLSTYFDEWAKISGRQIYWTPDFQDGVEALAPDSEAQAIAIAELLSQSTDLNLLIVSAANGERLLRAEQLKRRFGERAKLDQIVLEQDYKSRFFTHLQQGGVLVKLVHTYGAPVIQSDESTSSISNFEVNDAANIAISGRSPRDAFDLVSGQKLFSFNDNGLATVSADGRYLFAWDFWDHVNEDAHALLIYDLATGLVKNRIEIDTYWKFSSYNIRWSPTENVIAWVTRGGDVSAFDVEADTLKFIATPGSQRRTGPIAWSPDGEVLYFGQGGTKETFALDADTGEVLQTFEQANWPHGMEATPDGKWLIGTDNRSKMHFWNLETGEWSAISLPLAGFQTALSPSGKFVAVSNRFQTGDEGNERGRAEVAIVSVEDQRVIATSSRPTRTVSFGNSDEVLFEHNSDGVRFIETRTLKPISTYIEPNANFDGALVDPDCQCLLTISSEGVSVWSLESGRRIHQYDLLAQAMVADKVQPSVFYARGEDGVFKIDNGRFQSEMLVTAEELGFLPQRLASSGRFLGIAGAVNKRSPDAKFVIYDTNDWTTTLSRSFEIVTAARNFRYLIRSKVTRFDIDESGRSAVAHTSWQDGLGMSVSESKEVQIFDAAVEGIAERLKVNKIDALAFVADVKDGTQPVFMTRRGNWINGYNTSGEPITLEDSLRSEILQTDLQRAGYETVRSGLGRKRTDGDYDWLHLSEPIRKTLLLSDQGLIALVSQKNKIFFVDIENHELQLTLETLSGDQWAAYSPEGFFTGSMNISDKLSWRRGTSITPMTELATRMERPDLLAEKLQSVGRGQAKNAAAVLQDEADQVFNAIQSIPYTLNRIGDFDQASDSEVFAARFTLTGDDRAELPPVSIKVNGREFVFEPSDYEYEDGELIIPLTLEAGTSFVEASTIWQGLTLNSVSMRVVTEIAESVSVDKSAPRLFFFGAGVSDYADDDLELEFAHKDVQTIADMMRTTEGDLFSEVRTHLLLDTEATQSKIQREMDDFISQASADDVILIFLSGHGMQEVDNSLYFVPHDAETDRTYTLVDLKLVRQQLMKRPASQKALLWLDLCNAGAFGQEDRSKSLQRLVVTVDDAVKLVSEGSGVSVLASSAGRQESYEGAEYGGGHGAFTAALIEGLNGRSDREAGNSDGLVFVQELQTFVMRRVPQMTKGKQHPTVPLVSNLRDFPISVATP